MRARPSIAALGIASLATCVVVAATACIGTDPYAPGTQLGTFTVTGALKTNTCGTGTATAPDPWNFTVKLATDPGTLYWIQGSAPISGTLSPANVAALTSTSTQLAYAGDAGVGTCSIARNDSLSATLTPDPTMPHEYASFTGSITYVFSQASGSTDCSGVLGENGGGYAALPCTVAYAVTGTRTALPNKYGK